jgi:hypothetical protein
MKAINKLIYLTSGLLFLILGVLTGNLTDCIEIVAELLQVYQQFINLNIKPLELHQAQIILNKY